jgi:hypothetical protein
MLENGWGTTNTTNKLLMSIWNHQNTQKYCEIYSVLLPICTIITAIRVTCKYYIVEEFVNVIRILCFNYMSKC